MKMREGMGFTIEPMRNQGRRKVATEKDGWTVVTRDGKLSAQFEHTVAVTETGVEVLTLRRDERVYGEGVKPYLWFRLKAAMADVIPGESRGRERNGTARSEEHTSELQSLMRNSYAVFCLKKKQKTKTRNNNNN